MKGKEVEKGILGPTPGNPRTRELGLLNLTNEFKMKQPFVIMIMNWTVWKSPKKSRGNLGFWTEVMNLPYPM